MNFPVLYGQNTDCWWTQTCPPLWCVVEERNSWHVPILRLLYAHRYESDSILNKCVGENGEPLFSGPNRNMLWFCKTKLGRN